LRIWLIDKIFSNIDKAGWFHANLLFHFYAMQTMINKENLMILHSINSCCSFKPEKINLFFVRCYIL